MDWNSWMLPPAAGSSRLTRVPGVISYNPDFLGPGIHLAGMDGTANRLQKVILPANSRFLGLEVTESASRSIREGEAAWTELPAICVLGFGSFG